MQRPGLPPDEGEAYSRLVWTSPGAPGTLTTSSPALVRPVHLLACSAALQSCWTGDGQPRNTGRPATSMARSSVTQSQVLLLLQRAAAGLQPSLRESRPGVPSVSLPQTVSLQVLSAEPCPLKVPSVCPKIPEAQSFWLRLRPSS